MPLTAPSYRIDWERIEAAVTARTRLLILNSPHNPTGMVMQEADIVALSALCARHDIYLIGDEVYEHMVFDQCEHLSLCAYANGMPEALLFPLLVRPITTGWKVGYCVAPPNRRGSSDGCIST